MSLTHYLCVVYTVGHVHPVARHQFLPPRTIRDRKEFAGYRICSGRYPGCWASNDERKRESWLPLRRSVPGLVWFAGGRIGDGQRLGIDTVLRVLHRPHTGVRPRSTSPSGTRLVTPQDGQRISLVSDIVESAGQSLNRVARKRDKSHSPASPRS